jgi:predicted DNA-binding transcriptional regulator YafY
MASMASMASTAEDQRPKWRTVDPLGLVTARGHGYLLATRSGADRTYRLSRILAAEELDEPAERPDQIDLDRIWQERSTRFRTGGDQVTVRLRLHPARRDDLVATALAVRLHDGDPDDDWLRLEASFQDRRHAEWALWQLASSAEALSPDWLRVSLHNRAAAIATRYAEPPARLG